MGATCRFTFVAGVRMGEDGWPPWPDPASPWLGEVARNGTWVAWRLLGSNNRELGRSRAVFPDLVSARCAGASVRDRVTEMSRVISRGEPRIGWNWRLSIADQTYAASARGFLRHQDCAYNLAAFVAGAQNARIGSDEPTVVRSPHVVPLARTGQRLMRG